MTTGFLDIFLRNIFDKSAALLFKNEEVFIPLQNMKETANELYSKEHRSWQIGQETATKKKIVLWKAYV